MEYSKKLASMPPLSAALFHILISLCTGDRHGYGIMVEIAERTGNQVKLGPASFYRILNDAIGAGLVEESKSRPSPDLDDSRRSRYYRLTSLGRKVAKAETERLSAMLAVSRRMLANT
jgi:DNA-binding PadR family transcriptional regulator